MVEASVRGNQIKLTINVWYDRSSRIHISSNDPDLGKGPHTNLQPGSGADKAFRKVLDKFGKLPGERVGRNSARSSSGQVGPTVRLAGSGHGPRRRPLDGVLVGSLPTTGRRRQDETITAHAE
jgi:hypothetical protein